MAKADYGQALDELEELHRAGKMSDARYELHKQQLLAEATRESNPLWRFGNSIRVLVMTVLAIGAVLGLVLIVLALVGIFVDHW